MKFEKRIQAVLDVISSHGSNGIGHQELAFEVGLDRKNLRKYLLQLLTRKLIRRAIGRFGRYYVTDKALTDLKLQGRLFGENIARRLKEISIRHDVKGADFINHTTFFHHNTRFFTPRFSDKDDLEKDVFDFSNRIGAFVIYTFIQAMNKANEIVPLNEAKELDRHQYDSRIDAWVEEAIPIGQLIREFRQGINYGPDFQDYPHKPKQVEPFFQLNELAINQLNRAFSNVYPGAFHQFELVRTDLPNAVRNYKTWMEGAVERMKNQDKIIANCEHKKMADVRAYDLKIKQLHCPDCGLWQPFPRKDAAKIDAINNEISKKLGQEAVQFCNDIQFYFETNPNKELGISDLTKYWLDFRMCRLEDEKAFTQELLTVLDVLTSFGYIQEVEKAVDARHTTYLRKN